MGRNLVIYFSYKSMGILQSCNGDKQRRGKGTLLTFVCQQGGNARENDIALDCFNIQKADRLAVNPLMAILTCRGLNSRYFQYRLPSAAIPPKYSYFPLRSVPRTFWSFSGSFILTIPLNGAFMRPPIVRCTLRGTSCIIKEVNAAFQLLKIILFLLYNPLYPAIATAFGSSIAPEAAIMNVSSACALVTNFVCVGPSMSWVLMTPG